MTTITSQNIFSVEELTEAVNKLPLMPMRMRKLFRQKSVKTTSVMLDLREGRIVLVENQDRRDPPKQMGGEGSKRSSVSLPTAHLPLADIMKPEDVQDVRGFGTSEPITAASVVNDKMMDLKNSVAMTAEFHRLGAAQGVIYDADGTTIMHDLYKTFGVAQKKLNLVFPSNSTKFNPILKIILEGKRHAEQKLGGTPAQRFEAVVGSDFYDMLTTHELVRKLYEDWQARQQDFGDNDYRKRGFTYGNVTWIEASEIIGNRQLVPPKKAHMYPVGNGVFVQYNAPANWVETVNTLGNEFYARMEPIPMGRGHNLEVQSNPLAVCTYPEALVEFNCSFGAVQE